MSFGMVRLIANLFLQGMMIHTFCELLEMRSKRVFALVSMLGMVACLSLEEFGLPPVVRVILAGPVLIIGFPILYSRGPLPVRASRAVIVNTGVILTEFVGNFIQGAFLGVDMPTSPRDTNVAGIALTYAIMLPLVAITFQSIIAFFKRTDRYHDATFDPPIIALLIWTYMLTVAASFRLTVADIQHGSLPFVMLVYTVLAIIIAFATLELVRRSVQSHREATTREAALTQDERVRDEIESLVRRSTETRRLRHDLANQMDIVCELAEKGHIEEALAYVDRLQKRARHIVSPTDGVVREER